MTALCVAIPHQALTAREREILQLVRIRRRVAVSSLLATKERLDATLETSATALEWYQDAILIYGPDEDDSPDVARMKAEKLEAYERNYLNHAPIAASAINRALWEVREAQRARIVR